MDQAPSLDKLTIETPEQIPLQVPLAGIGSRFLALALDTLIQTVVAVFFVIAGIVLAAVSFAASKTAGIWVVAVLILVFFTLQFGYFAFFEAYWNGQTPGKRQLDLRVIKDNGQPITTYDSVARNLLRIVDSLPGFYGVGIVSVLLSAKNKRLGDYVAGTVVVHEKPLETPPALEPVPAEPPSPSGYDAARLTPEEFAVIETYLMRRKDLPANVRSRLGPQIIQRIAPKLGISPEDQSRPEPLLEKLAAEYRERARYR